MKKKNLVLVTGMLRSGTTWTAKALALAPGMKYIDEPFNPDRQRKNCPFDHYYTYLDDKTSPADQEPAIKFINHIRNSPTFYLADRIRRMNKSKILKNSRILCREKKNFFGRPLIKDPVALFNAEWMQDTFGADIIIVLRHPAAFIGSLKAAGWTIPFRDILSEKRMLTEHFQPFLPLIEQYADARHDLIDQGILFWNMAYFRIRQYREKHGSRWYFVRHEDLSKDPVAEFSRLFQFLEIDFSDKLKSKIIRTTDGSTINRHSRNSLQNLETWKTRLTGDEMERIKAGTSELYPAFYDERDWE